MRFALAQHLGQVSLGVYIHQQNLLALQSKASTYVIHGGALTYAALLIHDGNYVRACHVCASFSSKIK